MTEARGPASPRTSSRRLRGSSYLVREVPEYPPRVTEAPGPPLAPGEAAEFDGYRLERHLGSGAVGSVYLARDTLLERDVALKRLQDPAVEGPAVERFLVEARALARLQHPNVVAVHRVGAVAGRPYIVYELVRGRSLDRLEKPVAEPLLLHVALDLARGLEAAHARGVVHRDVKPSNAILSDDGPIKLVDFGLARIGEHEVVPGAILGTPSYMAPEAWDGEVLDARSDLYSLGALLHELATGAPPHAAPTEEALAERVTSRDAQPVAWRAPGLSPELAAVIDRCLRRDPEARFGSAEALLWALAPLVPRPDAGQLARPYPALAAFRPEDRRVFFGRERDAERLLERLRAAPLVVVAGDSGVGKSSLLGAGLAPRIAEDALGEGRRWAWARLQPGRHPLAALLGALGPWIDAAEAPIEAEELAQSPDLLARRLRARLGAHAGLVIAVDQLEELVTAAGDGEAPAAARALARLADRVPGVRVVATVRSDLLSRVATLPELGEALTGAVHVLRPLGRDDLRALIVQPARLFGARFESEALVEALVDAVGDRGSRLPLLEFALAELWALRDAEAGVIRARSLEAIGGVAGALARHADGVLAGLDPAQRALARDILLHAVLPSGTSHADGATTRRPFTARELALAPAPPAALDATLEALVQGRLLLARTTDDETTYELAHEALIPAWSTLAEWLRADGGKRAAHDRATRAAAEWVQRGRPDEGLLGARALAELDAAGLLPSELGEDARTLLGASRARLRRQRWIRIGAAPLVLLVIGAVYGASELAQAARRERMLVARLGEAQQAQAEARAAEAEGAEAQRAAQVELARGSTAAEGAWSVVLAARADERTARARESRALEAGLALAPSDPRVRTALAELLYREVVADQRDRRDEARDAALVRLAAYDDDGTRRARLAQPATLVVAVTPAGTEVSLAPIVRGAQGRREVGAPRVVGRTPLPELHVPPGDHLLRFTAPDGRPPALLPIAVERGERRSIDFVLPERVPDGFVFVPPGDVSVGSPEEGTCRTALLGTLPLHRARTAAFFIARHEVTFGEWLHYLDALPEPERARRTPRVTRERAGLEVRRAGDAWALSLTPTEHTLEARAGEAIVYPGRSARARVDWLRAPVLGISPDDAQAYAAWLDRTGRVPGARLCREDEWERAARGADDRRYPHGDLLLPDDANHDATYGRDPGGFGPDEVGAHPASASPFGVHDLAGNAWEWAVSTLADQALVARGGGWYEDASGALSGNRVPAEASMRDAVIGARLCASP